ncbi:MAG: hypothetical protein LC115_00110 [Bacteroidia bacterium]|nr:hypothetical protein [Bacteroidia bacterium]
MITDKTTSYVIFLGETYEGKEHDKTILEYEEIDLKEEIKGYLDIAYLNVKIKNLTAILPTKKPKGKELTEEQKQQNKEKSKIRLSVEPYLFLAINYV